MGFEIFIYILRWVTKLIGKICDLPPAHPSSYFMTSPLSASEPAMISKRYLFTVKIQEPSDFRFCNLFCISVICSIFCSDFYRQIYIAVEFPFLSFIHVNLQQRVHLSLDYFHKSCEIFILVRQMIVVGNFKFVQYEHTI
jgi:hypothetical protein